MRKPSGFTLIVLMVVMAIIAILATAGLSAYGGYLKKARDATRIADMRALSSIVQATLDNNGIAPALSALKTAIIAMNNGEMLLDPMDGDSLCLDQDDQLSECGYRYTKCNEGGYVLGIQFESASNKYRYTQDEMNPDYSNLATGDSYFEMGNCVDFPGTFDFIRLP